MIKIILVILCTTFASIASDTAGYNALVEAHAKANKTKTDHQDVFERLFGKFGVLPRTATATERAKMEEIANENAQYWLEHPCFEYRYTPDLPAQAKQYKAHCDALKAIYKSHGINVDQNLLPKGDYGQKGEIYLTACAIVEFNNIPMPAWMAMLETMHASLTRIIPSNTEMDSAVMTNHDVYLENGWNLLISFDVHNVKTFECSLQDCIFGNQARFIQSAAAMHNINLGDFSKQIDVHKKNVSEYKNPGPYPLSEQQEAVCTTKKTVESDFGETYKKAKDFVSEELKKIDQTQVIPGLVWKIRLEAEEIAGKLLEDERAQYIQCVQWLLSEYCIRKEHERRQKKTGCSLEYNTAKPVGPIPQPILPGTEK